MKIRLSSRVTYANLTSTLALALALSTGGAYAVATIGASDIKDDAVRTRHIADGQVTKTDLRDGAVTRAKLAPNAQARIAEFTMGPHNFATDSTACADLTFVLPPSAITGSNWTAQLRTTVNDVGLSGPTLNDVVYSVPGRGELGASEYRVYALSGPDNIGGPDNIVCVELRSGQGEDYLEVRFVQTVPTEVVQVPTSDHLPSQARE